jgi:multidrug efflux pump subunit AcrB
MHISALFIKRPIGTTLLTMAVLLSGAVAYVFLPVASLPEVDFPTIQVSAGLPGASPETMASAVATPLERQFTRIAGVSEMTSSSLLGSTNSILTAISTRLRGTCKQPSMRPQDNFRPIFRRFPITAR